ncbi:MAG TPA: crotonase/enoyl-CoA hydratase family protein [Myxococcota bacterium]|nr:crotonase/enoyl-CoA hydratase family protein [Myxococcota bacterium]HRY94492.1 crotonase/enoyl-CoA hydratase family protein [Myxococcota bacterium]HSA20060.1 crotonase/enoyl-CoA hydratase family protein [Myxococcota bacterium]
MTAPLITAELRGHVYWIGLNRAEKRNAFNLAMLRGLAEAFDAFEHEPEARCALLHAHGEHFTGGLDLGEVGPAVAQGETLMPAGLVDPMDCHPPRRTKPVVMAAQGWCLTIGVELLLASDIRLCARGARFSQLEVGRGIMPFGGATLRFPRQCGWGNAMRHMLTGDFFDADEAHRIGLVQEVTAPGELLARAQALAEEVAAQAPLAVQATLRNCRLALEQGDAAAVAAFEPELKALLQTEDAMEGVRSFLERRKASFQGK